MNTRDPRHRGLRETPSSMQLGGLALAALLLGACITVTAEEGDEVYLGTTSGPYRGRIVDAVTKQPLAEVVVLAVWYYRVPVLVQWATQYHDALEVLTDEQGYFVVDAPEIERQAPPRTMFPNFIIFKPGYLYFKGWFASPEAMALRAKQPLLGVVELRHIAGMGRRQRQENLGVPPGGGVPDEKMPLLLKAYAEELEAMKKER